MESDPIGIYGGISSYAYADSSPVASMDPLGLLPITAPLLDDENTVCCKDGRLTLCMYNPGNPRYKCLQVLIGMDLHEMTHLQETRRKRPNVCPARGNFAVAFNLAGEARMSELAAFQEQIEYLVEQKSKGWLSDDCVREIDVWLNYIHTEAIPQVNAGTYGQ